MSRPKKKDKKKVTGFSLSEGQIAKIAKLSKTGKVSRSSLVGSWADMIWEKEGAKVASGKKTTKKKSVGKKTGGKILKR